MLLEHLNPETPIKGALAKGLCETSPVNALTMPPCYERPGVAKRHTVRSVERRRRRKLRLMAR
ncbi:MAG: hypothetical protein MRY64_16545 [Hyphomonadaceae bacterium]|nr:hypothetical protein [Hyphomonadaceae bacterium]